MAKEKKKKKAGKGKEKAAENDSQQKLSLLKRLLRPKMFILFLIVLLVISGGCFAGWYFFLKSDENNASGENELQEQTGKKDEEMEVVIPPPFPEIVDLKPLEKIPLKKTENLNYLSISVSLELSDPAMRATLIEQADKIRQIIDAEAGKLTWFVLRNPEGKLQFKYRLLKLMNKELTAVRVRNLYFTRFIML